MLWILTRDGYADADIRIYRAICRLMRISASRRIGKYIRMAIPIWHLPWQNLHENKQATTFQSGKPVLARLSPLQATISDGQQQLPTTLMTFSGNVVLTRLPPL